VDSRCCHLRTHKDTATGEEGGAAFLGPGGSFPIATACSTSILMTACPCAPILPPSPIANGTNVCRPQYAAEIGWVEVRPALNLVSSTCLAANPGTTATLDKMEFRYTVVTTPSRTRCRPGAPKSNTIKSPRRLASPFRKPRVSSTIAALGTPASSTM